MIHTAAYWLLHNLKGLAPKTSFWRDAQFDTIRLGFIKMSPPSSYPYKQDVARFAARAQAMPP